MKRTIYLDYAAATPMDPAVVAAMQPYFTKNFFNPSATYLASKAVLRDIQEARGRIAHWLGARGTEIVFTAGGTEANNLAIHGVMQQFPDGNLIVSAIEHESVLAPTEQHDHQIAPVTRQGVIDVQALKKLINEQTVIVSIMYVNNEVGTIQPLKQISQLIEQVRTQRRASGNMLPLYLHSDACQAAAYLDLHASRLGVDLMTLNAGKIYGPKQAGVLYVKTGAKLSPQILGGGQERGMRSGTENVAHIVGLAEALDLVQSRRNAEVKRLAELQKLFITLLEDNIPNCIINGSLKQRLPNNVHVSFPGTDNERLMMQLDEAGIMCAVGSACSAASDEPSHVLAAIGLNEAAIRSSLRFTMGRETDETAVRQTVETLLSLIS